MRPREIYVECSNDAECETAALERSFDTIAEARKFISVGGGRKFRCVWLSEWGVHYTKSGKRQFGLIYFWWTPETHWGQNPDAGVGYLAGKQMAVSYLPAPRMDC